MIALLLKEKALLNYSTMVDLHEFKINPQNAFIVLFTVRFGKALNKVHKDQPA